jgi:hypothetical protein
MVLCLFYCLGCDKNRQVMGNAEFYFESTAKRYSLILRILQPGQEAEGTGSGESTA